MKISELAKLPRYANHICGECNIHMKLIVQSIHNPPTVKTGTFEDRGFSEQYVDVIHSTETYQCPNCKKEVQESRW